MINGLRPPLVTNADRACAMSQLPDWARHDDATEEPVGEIVDDGGWLEAEPPDAKPPKSPNGAQFVSEQADRFERFFADQRKTYADWSSLWRKSWWPKAHPEKRFPRSAPKIFQPFFRAGSPEFDRALAVATPAEQRMWNRFGVAQFAPDDPRLGRVQVETKNTRAAA
jgi:hypothetical protein